MTDESNPLGGETIDEKWEEDPGDPLEVALPKMQKHLLEVLAKGGKYDGLLVAVVVRNPRPGQAVGILTEGTVDMAYWPYIFNALESMVESQIEYEHQHEHSAEG